MSKNYFHKTRFFLVLMLLFVLFFQSTLPNFQNKIYFQDSFVDLINVDCKDEEHSHPPLSPGDPSNNSEQFANLDSNKSFFIFNERPLIVSYIYGDKYFKNYKKLPKLLAEQFLPARGPPLFEV